MAKKGRQWPNEYKDTYPEKLIELMSQGNKDCQIYAYFGVAEQTYYRWLREKPAFQAAHELGLSLCEKHWEDVGKELMAKGDNKAFNYWIAFMNRKFKWRDRNDTSITNNTQININQQINHQKSEEELLEFIKDGLDQLNAPIDVELIEIKKENG